MDVAARARRWRIGAALAAAALGAACGGDGEAPPADAPGAPGATGAAPLPGGARDVAAVQVAAFPDSTAARRLRDSLAGAGWHAVVRRGGGDNLPPWRVNVAHALDADVVAQVAAGFAALGRQVRVVQDTATLPSPRVRVHVVNGGTSGMASRVRWLLSPDRRALIVTEDPAAVENEPLPNGFLYAAERGAVVVQRDSVWDVAPDPAWRRVAYGRGFIVSAEGRDSVSARGWLAVAGRTNMNVNAVRRAAFPVSGMSPRYGFAQPVIEWVVPDSLGASELTRQVTTPVPLAGGWRVRWSADGETLGVGLPPERSARDDAPASAWVAVDSRTYLHRGELPSYVRMVAPTWTEGPVLDVSVPLPSEGRALAIEGGNVTSRGGWITVRGRVTEDRPRVIGPGVALTATAGGHFVVALAPMPPERRSEQRVRLVTYQLQP